MKKLLFILALFIFINSECFCQTIQKDFVYFDFDKYDLTNAAIHNLDSMGRLLTKFAAKVDKIEIGGHCDSLGEHSYNDHLSNQRATAVHQYLVSKGVKDSLINRVDFFGKRKPITTNNDSIERAKNRRVEITVYWIKSKTSAPVASAPKKVSKDGYIPHKAITVKLDDLGKIGELDSNTTIVLPNLNFYGGRHQLIATAYPTLEKLLEVLKANPSYKIELQGHVCCHQPGMGFDGYDWDNNDDRLSLNRAKAIYDYLVSKGIDKNRLGYKGFGGEHKLVPEITDSDKEQNRRVEIKLISK